MPVEGEEPPVSKVAPAPPKPAPKPAPPIKVPTKKAGPKPTVQYNVPADSEEIGAELQLGYGEDEVSRVGEGFARDYDGDVQAQIPQLSTGPIEIMPEEPASVIVNGPEAAAKEKPPESPDMKYEPMPCDKTVPAYDDSADALVGGTRGWEGDVYEYEEAEEMMEEEEIEVDTLSRARPRTLTVKEETAAPLRAGEEARAREPKMYTKGKSKRPDPLEKAKKRFLNYNR